MFKHMESAQKDLQEPSKTIDGRITVCNLATVSTNLVQTTEADQRKLL
jgi:heterogeneous nuclear ribonucleoprotein A1/A3